MGRQSVIRMLSEIFPRPKFLDFLKSRKALLGRELHPQKSVWIQLLCESLKSFHWVFEMVMVAEKENQIEFQRVVQFEKIAILV